MFRRLQRSFLLALTIFMSCSAGKASAHISTEGWWIVPGFYAVMEFDEFVNRDAPFGLEVSLNRLNDKMHGFGLVVGGEKRFLYAEAQIIMTVVTVGIGVRRMQEASQNSHMQYTIATPFFYGFPYVRSSPSSPHRYEVGLMMKFPIESNAKKQD